MRRFAPILTSAVLFVSLSAAPFARTAVNPGPLNGSWGVAFSSTNYPDTGSKPAKHKGTTTLSVNDASDAVASDLTATDGDGNQYTGKRCGKHFILFTSGMQSDQMVLSGDVVVNAKTGAGKSIHGHGISVGSNDIDETNYTGKPQS